MDTVDYTDAGVRRMKGIRHLSDWQLIIPLLLLTSYTACDISTPSSVPELADSNIQSENLTPCTGQTASFTWAYEIPPFFAVEWYFENTPIAQTSKESFLQDDISITPEYTDRFHLQTTGKVGFNLTNVTKADTGNYRCIVTLKSTDIPKELNKKLQVKEIKLRDYNITVTNTTEGCRTLKCGEPVGTTSTYEWSIRVNGSDKEPTITTTNTFEFCQNTFNCSVKCQRDHDCTETSWMCFKAGQSGWHSRKRRTLDEQLVRCGTEKDSDEDTDSGNLDDSSPITTGIVVAVVFAVIVGIAGIAILTVVTLKKLRSRAGRRADRFKEEQSDGELEELKDRKHLQDKETCEQVNLNPTT